MESGDGSVDDYPEEEEEDDVNGSVTPRQKKRKTAKGMNMANCCVKAYKLHVSNFV